MKHLLLATAFLFLQTTLLFANNEKGTASNTESNTTSTREEITAGDLAAPAATCVIDYQSVVIENRDGCSSSNDGSICVTIKYTGVPLNNQFDLSINNGITWIVGASGTSTVCRTGLNFGTNKIIIRDRNDCTVVYPGNPTIVDWDICFTNSDIKNRLINSHSIDTNDDGEIQRSEALAFTGTIDISGLAISDLTDIAEFTNITGLNCRNNRFTTIDVTNFTQLTYLNCDQNILSTIDVSNNILLQYFDCSNNNLNILNIDYNTQLNNLVCSNNTISSINFTYNTEIDTVYCDHNLLTALDMATSGCDFLDCSYNDISSITPLNYFRYLNCSNNELSGTLEMGSSTNIQYLDCSNNELSGLPLDYAVELTYLDCGENNLDTLDVTGTIVQTLDCDDNNLTELNVAGQRLISLRCQGNSISELDLSSSIDLQLLYVGGNELTELDLTNNTKLETLSCTSNQLRSLDLKNNTLLSLISCAANDLISLDIRNGNNTNILPTALIATSNNLTCISVDDLAYATANWTRIDPETSFNTDCSTVPSFTSLEKVDVLGCYGDETGSITIEVTGGTEPYSYSVDGGLSWLSSSIIDSLTAGEYYIMVKDYNENEVTYTSNPVEISQPNEMIINNLNIVHDNGSSNGRISFSVLNGTYPKTYRLNEGIWQSSNNFSSLPGGDYLIQAKDFNNCIKEQEVTVEEYLYVPDPVFKAYLVAHTGINTNADTAIFVSEAEAFSGAIEIGGTSVSNLTGIEAFSSISALYFYNTSVSEVDLSNNTKLEIIECYGTLLTELDLSHNPLLNSLDCSTTLLSSLDIRNGNNSILTDFDARNNNLSCISVSDYAFARTNWTNIDAGVLFSPDCSDLPLFGNVEATTLLTCYGDETGVITITASGGYGELSYSIDDGLSWQSANSFNNLPAGTYYIQIKDEAGVIIEWGSNPVTIAEPGEIDYNFALTDPSCMGTSTGEISFISITGGTGDFTFSIDGGLTYVEDSTFTGLTEGEFSAILMDALGCTDTTLLTLTQPIHDTIDFIDIENIIGCAGNANGTISIDAPLLAPPAPHLKSAKGASPRSYSIDGGSNWQASNRFEDLKAGEYTAVVKIDDCEYPWYLNPVIITERDSVKITTINITGDYGTPGGEISITASGGTNNFEYSVDGGSTYETSGTFTPLTYGSYNLVVRDDIGCMADSTVTVPDLSIKISNVETTDVTGCFGDASGIITITSTAGYGSHSYSIDNGVNWQSSNEFTGLTAGSYTIVAKDEEGNEVAWGSNPVTIAEPSELSYFFELTDPLCIGASNGEISFISITGGTGDYTFSIDGGLTYVEDSTFSGLAEGEFSAIVMDALGCSDTTLLTLSQPSHDTIDFIDIENITGCAGNANGIISIDAPLLAPPAPPLKSSKGASPKSYSIDGGSNWQASNIFEDLKAGEYFLVVKDNDCEYPWYLNPVIITEPDTLKLSNIEIKGDYGTLGGEISITASGGDNMYEYSIDGGSTFETTETFTSLSIGSYNLVVRDFTGCEADSTVSVPDWSITISDVISTDSLICYDDGNGSITINATGGAGTLSYSINNGMDWQSSNEFTGRNGGEYEIKVKDSNDTIVSWGGNPVIIFEPVELYFDYEETPPSCEGVDDGVISFTYVEGGTGSYLYSIDDGETFSSESMFDSLAYGEYDLLVMDEKGCTDDNFVIFREPELHDFNVDIVDISCFGESNGIINCGSLMEIAKPQESALGEKPSIYYSIDNGITWQIEQLFQNLTAGEYYVWRKTSDVCMEEYDRNPVVVEEPEKLVIDSIWITPDDGTSNGRISIFISGGTGLIEYSINGGTVSSLHDLNSLSSGDYHYVINDQNDCTIDSTITVHYDPIPEDETIANTSFSSGDTTCYGAYQTITVGDVAGNPVDFNVGSSTSLIAGSSITFLPGVHIYEGAYLTATITTDSSFCDVAGASGSPIVAAEKTEKSKEDSELQKDAGDALLMQSLKVFPNPNNGRFVVELKGFNETTDLVIYNTLGSIVYNVSSIEAQSSIEIGNLKRGLYFIKAFDASNSLTKKMIVE